MSNFNVLLPLKQLIVMKLNGSPSFGNQAKQSKKKTTFRISVNKMIISSIFQLVYVLFSSIHPMGIERKKEGERIGRERHTQIQTNRQTDWQAD